MIVRMKTHAAGPDGTWPVGSVRPCDEATGQALIDGGYADLVNVPETTAVAPAERAVTPRAKPRRTRKKAVSRETVEK